MACLLRDPAIAGGLDVRLVLLPSSEAFERNQVRHACDENCEISPLTAFRRVKEVEWLHGHTWLYPNPVIISMKRRTFSSSKSIMTSKSAVMRGMP
jgi:hypothetical protein